MKFAVTLPTLVCFLALSAANDKLADSYLYQSLPVCVADKDNLSLNFSNSEIHVIGKNFATSNLITCLDIQRNKVERILGGAFNKLPKLTHLYLSHNNFINSHYLFTCGGHENLKVLRLDQASQSAITSSINIPGKYPNLVYLSARQNGFYDLLALPGKELESANTQVSPFPKLKYLDLSGNNMMGKNFVELLPKELLYLNLQNNSYTSLYMPKLEKMTTLMLDNNRIAYVRRLGSNPNGLMLSGMTGLKYLSLSNNRVNYIEKIAFSHNTKLTHLRLSGNRIDYLFPDTFANLKDLKTLDLGRNLLKVVPEISSITNIDVLMLNCNMIKDITAKAFAKMPKLTELSLKGNQINEINVNGLTDLRELTKLDLSKNKLVSLPAGWTSTLTKLKYLDLSENQFTSLQSLSLTNNLPLLEIYLEMNPIKFLDARSFETLPRNATVNLAPRSGIANC